MAFNPLANFQKYKKIWMAGILLITMVTFVLCSGFGDQNSGLQGLLQRLFARRGDSIARIDGTTYYSDDFRQLKESRELANKYMRKLMEACAGRLQDWLKNPDELKQIFRDRELTQREQDAILLRYREYQEKLKKPRYFEGSNKLDDLVNFQVMLRYADTIPVRLNDDFTREMVKAETVLHIPAERKGKDEEQEEPIRFPVLSKDELARLSVLVQRESGQGVNDDRIFKALQDEFRVQLAKLTLMEAPNASLELALMTGRVDHGAIPLLFAMMQNRASRDKQVLPRLSLAPDQWRDYFKKYRATFDVTLLPIDANELAKLVKDPDDKTLLEFFNANKSRPEDITSDNPGLQYSRDRFMVHVLMADPKGSQFKDRAEATVLLQTAPPFSIDPFLPLAFTQANPVIADALKGEAIEKRIARRAQFNVEDMFFAGRVGDEHFAHFVLGYLARNRSEKESAVADANLIAAGLGDGPQLLASLPVYSIHQALQGKERVFQEEVARQAEKDRKVRLPVFATFLGLSEDPLLALMPAAAVAEPSGDFRVHRDGIPLGRMVDAPFLAEERKLPQSIYLDVEWDRLVSSKATEYVQDVMKKAREELKSSFLAGNESRLRPVLRELIKQHGLKLVSSKKAYTQSEMEQAPELEPLKKAFEKHAQTVDFFEGRRDDKMLSSKSFAQALFFTPGEKHSVEGRSFTPRAWPPDMKLQQSEENIGRALAFIEGRPVEDGKFLHPRQGEEIAEELKFADPRATMNTVALFERSENPIIFWKEDPPKGDVTPRWVTQIKEDLDTQVAAIQKDLTDRVERIKNDKAASKNPAEMAKRIENARKIAKDEEETLRKKAEAEMAEVRERTLQAYKLAEARDKLAPKYVEEFATALAGTGGESTLSLRPYEDTLAKLSDKLAQQGGKEPIVLRDLAPWYRVMKRTGDFEYRDFTITPQDNIPFPRADMGKKLLELPALEGPLKIEYAPVDSLNKDLYSLSQKAFEELRAAKKTLPGAKARIVQVIPNRPRTVYYIALLTSPSNPPAASFKEFLDSLSIRHTGGIDPFLERVYAEAGKQWEEEIYRGLRSRLSVRIEENEATKNFDTDSGS